MKLFAKQTTYLCMCNLIEIHACSASAPRAPTPAVHQGLPVIGCQMPKIQLTSTTDSPKKKSLHAATCTIKKFFKTTRTINNGVQAASLYYSNNIYIDKQRKNQSRCGSDNLDLLYTIVIYLC